MGSTPNLEPNPNLAFFFYSIQVFFCTEKSSNGAKRKKVELGHDFEFGTDPNLAFFLFHPSFFLWRHTKRSSNGAKRKKTKLRPNFEFGTIPKFRFIFAPSRIFLVPREVWMEQKFGARPKVDFFTFCSIRAFLDIERNSNGEKRKCRARVQLQQKNELSFFLLQPSFFQCRDKLNYSKKKNRVRGWFNFFSKIEPNYSLALKLEPN